ncbi:class I adenylate-forming enzyme family protein [Streptomyces sp. ME02-6979.5a]|uniref:class I adenylate-forming enzyme family protein n=1 Tax=Streptomyces sp. ME02-6979.5a TaxID=462925 RepID=UPI0029BA5BAC|nr:class I adenylate-forming enzyme family protein [Streptomyces sp. ME02-6979.5a]MDX3339687.1 class I adenylate-forming enzyme family protein [Streptomyces sp. ME02-6979.5a]
MPDPKNGSAAAGGSKPSFEPTPELGPRPTGHAILHALETAAGLRPEGWAVRDPYRALTYPELVESVRANAAKLGAAGVQRGDLAMLESTHDTAYLTAYFSALSIGVNVMPYDPAMGSAEIKREMARHGVGIRLVPHVAGTEVVRLQVDPRAVQSPSLSAELASGGLVLLSTSGTGGLPKRALHSPDRLVMNAAAHASSVGLDRNDTTLLILSPAFGYCHTSQILAHLLVGGRMVFPPRPAMPFDLVSAMRAGECTNTTMVPHQMGDVLIRALADVPTLRQVALGGSAVTPEFLRRVTAGLPDVEILQTWGMTECGPRLTTWRSTRDPLAQGCVGRPINGVGVGTRFAAGPAGLAEEPVELYAHTPYAMLGYLSDSVSEADVLVAAGLIRTGDLGRVDEDGLVYVHGRLKNLIDVAGKKFSAEELEQVVGAVDGVTAVRVLGRDDPRRGQRPVALVVAERDDLTVAAEQIHEVVRTQLAPHKWLQDVEFVESLERTVNGKIGRAERHAV